MNENTGSGKWRLPGVPHLGWNCFLIDENEDDDFICEMCEKQHIRFIHHMQHNEYPNVLLCGCICAGHMEGDYTRAKKRETDFKNTIARKRNWLTRNWRWSRNGNDYLITNGFRIVMFKRGLLWGFVVNHDGYEIKKFAPELYKTEEAAKLSAFEVMEKLKKHTALD